MTVENQFSYQLSYLEVREETLILVGMLQGDTDINMP